jgi:hypothetical protein
MTFGEMIREVKTEIKDANPNILLSLPDYINEALSWVTAEYTLPSLKKYSTVNTVVSQAWLSMPTGFNGRLIYVGDSDGEIQIIDGGIQELLRLHPALADVGSVTEVAIENSTLWYQAIPATATTLYVVYREDPDELVNSTDTPTCLPTYLHRGILVNKACALAYSVIEEGITGDKTNTMFYEGKVQQSIAQLNKWISQRRSNVSHSIWDV